MAVGQEDGTTWGASDVTGHQREFLSPIVLDQRGSEAPPLVGPGRQDTGEGRPRTAQVPDRDDQNPIR